ncbi:MAG: hypothetical protein ACR2F2_07745 [Pyrinomonadaceae bacterium]
MTEKEKKPTEQEIRKATKQLDSLLEKPEVFNILSEMADNDRSFGKARANPRKFLKEKGVNVPDNVEITLEQKALALKIRVTITICITFCIIIRGFVICRRTCVSGTVVLG